jgi:hypothetical protein
MEVTKATYTWLSKAGFTLEVLQESETTVQLTPRASELFLSGAHIATILRL